MTRFIEFHPTTLSPDYFNIQPEMKFDIDHYNDNKDNFFMGVDFKLSIEQWRDFEFLDGDIIVMDDLVWYFLKDTYRIIFFKNKELLIYSDEAFPRGVTYMDAKGVDKGLLKTSFLNNFKKVTYFIDNFHSDLQVQSIAKFSYSYAWSKLYLNSCTCDDNIFKIFSTNGDKINYNRHKFKMTNFYLEWHNLDSDFTYAIGAPKLFRIDLLNKLYLNRLNGTAGTYNNLPKTYFKEQKNYMDALLTTKLNLDNFPEVLGTIEQGNDTWSDASDFINFYPHTFYNSKLELVAESVADSPKRFNSFPLAQITEKTIRPLVLGKPFLLCASNQAYDKLVEWGFDWYCSVFGDYRGVDFEDTNNNICEILSDLSKYDPKEMQRIAEHNMKIAKEIAYTPTPPPEKIIYNISRV